MHPTHSHFSSGFTISGIVRVEFLNQRPSFASKSQQDLEAQHGDIDLIASFYHDYLLFMIHDRSFFALLSFQFCIVKVNPKPDIRMGRILCYSVGAVKACSCSATISFVHKQNCSNLPMVMSDKHLLNLQGDRVGDLQASWTLPGWHVAMLLDNLLDSGSDCHCAS